MLLAGDVSVDSWFRENHVPQVWRVYLATGLAEKNRACFGLIGTRLWRLPPTLPLSYEGKIMKTIFPQTSVHVLKTTTTRYMVGFIDLYFHFLANFAHMLFMFTYIYVMSHTVSLGYLTWC